MNNTCEWHKGEYAVFIGIGCDYCSSLLATKTCDNCKQEFLDWDDKSFDDIIAGPYVSASGDLMCMKCGPYHDREAELINAAEDYDEPEYDYLEEALIIEPELVSEDESNTTRPSDEENHS